MLTKCFAESSPSQGEAFVRKLHFRFLWSPIKFLSNDERHKAEVADKKALRFTQLRRNRLIGSSGKQKAVLVEDAVEDVDWKQPSELAFRSIGYKAEPFEGVPFDSKAGVIPNKSGRVLSSTERALSTDESECYEKGLYVVGWLKRGPTGIVGSNKWDAEETIRVIADDFVSKLKIQPYDSTYREDMLNFLTCRNVAYVDFNGWRRIDEEERKRGQRKGIEREKLLTWEELLELGGVRSPCETYGSEPTLITKK